MLFASPGYPEQELRVNISGLSGAGALLRSMVTQQGMAERIEQASKGKCQKQRIANGEKFNSYWDEIIFLFMKGRQFEQWVDPSEPFKIGTQYIEVLLFNKVIQQTEKTAPYLKNTVFENNETQKLP